jgi:hypothetical protein
MVQKVEKEKLPQWINHSHKVKQDMNGFLCLEKSKQFDEIQ